jgi:hypothetical protein
MSSYTITIAADDAGKATTTLKVEVTETAARITELLVRAGDGEGLTAGQVPAVDLDLLLRAVAPATQGQPAIPAPAPAPVATPATPPATGTTSDSAETAGTTTIAGESPSTTEDAAPAENDATPAAPAETGLADAAEPTPEANTTTRKASRTSGNTAATRKRTAAAKPAPLAKTTSRAAKAAKPKKNSDAGASGSERVYRRSPEDLDMVFQQVGTVAGVADHYNVPRHTAQGWVRTLRRKQTVPNPQ